MPTSELASRIHDKLKTKKILVCSHSVLGYPSLEDNPTAIEAFCNAGVDIMELQFPFSDPMADGPILLAANQAAVKRGTTVSQCFELAREVTKKNPETLFLIMTYYNIVYTRGLDAFAKETSEAGILGMIIPDLPIEESKPWIEVCKKYKLSPIFMVTPDTSTARMKVICEHASGFVYCVARKGITGEQSKFGTAFKEYLARVKDLTDLPTGVGFGVRTKEDVSELAGQTEIAIVCSKAIDILGKEGAEKAASFLSGLR